MEFKIQKFIKQRPHLVWYVKDLENLSQNSVVEHTLNYGRWEDIEELIKIMGIKKMSKIFKEQTKQKRSNYDKKIKNYFELYFKKYA